MKIGKEEGHIEKVEVRNKNRFGAQDVKEDF